MTIPTTSTPAGSDPSGPVGEPGPSKNSDAWVRNAIEWVLVIVGAVGVTLLLQATTVQAFSIPSASMEPTLRNGDRVVVNKWSYRLHDVHRGDVVVFRRPDNDPSLRVDDLIKRVVGLPGDSLVITGNHVEVNGKALDEPYLAPGTITDPNGGPIPCAAAKPCVIPAGDVWVMGDNRTNSHDSRWFGPIPESKIVGRAFTLIWPIPRWSGL